MDLKQIHQISVVTYDIMRINELLNTVNINLLKFRRDNIIIRYSSFIITLSDGCIMTINNKISPDIFTNTNYKYSDIVRLEVRNLNEEVRIFEKYHLDALGGIDIKEHGLFIEFYKSLIFNTLYSDELLSLMERNPCYESGLDLYEVMDTYPATIITDEEVNEIYSYIMDDIETSLIHTELMKPIHAIANKYTLNPKSIVVCNTGFNIKIYKNIKEFRFEECHNAIRKKASREKKVNDDCRL